MPSFNIDSYTEDTITVCIDISSSYTWYHILIYKNGNLSDTQAYYRNTSGKEMFLIENLSSGTEYKIEVRCSTSPSVDEAISLGSYTVTTGGGSSGGTTDPDEPNPDEPDPDEPDPDEPYDETEGLVYINGNWYIPYIYTSDGWIPAKAHIYNSGWKVTITE